MNKNITIPTILAATIFVAGIFAFSPVQEASTVHTTLIAGTVGLACLTDSATYSADQVDNDDFTLTFGKAITILGLRAQSTDTSGDGDGADEIGIEADPTVNGAIVQSIIVDDATDTENISSNEQTDLLTTMDLAEPMTVLEGGAVVFTVDASVGTVLEDTDIITFEVCGLITDPANFVDADLVITGNNLAE